MPTGQRILIVDDDVRLLKALRLCLTAWEVATETSAQTALERLRAGEQFGLVLSDLGMPGTTGMEFFAELQALRPDLAQSMIFMTGGALTQAERVFLQEIDNPQLSKPFEPHTLRDLVRQQLG